MKKSCTHKLEKKSFLYKEAASNMDRDTVLVGIID